MRGSRHATIPESSLSFKIQCGIPEERVCPHKGWGMQDDSAELDRATVPARPGEACRGGKYCVQNSINNPGPPEKQQRNMKVTTSGERSLSATLRGSVKKQQGRSTSWSEFKNKQQKPLAAGSHQLLRLAVVLPDMALCGLFQIPGDPSQSP